ncbi:MAG TPA: hypothetical protein PKL15_01100 [Saprospiraceae bacterium]|nr:hypothetical protein [Saprospiraceae bacterium]
MDQPQPVVTDTASLPGNGRSRQAQLSSSHTLFWRIFVPIFGTVFLAGFLLVFLLTAEEALSLPFPAVWLRIGTFLLMGGWLWLLRRTVWRLKRVDADDAFLYVTNYWTTVRYPWTDVQEITEKKRAGRRIVTITLRAPGRFGQNISFLPGSHLYEWLAEHKKQDLLLAN